MGRNAKDRRELILKMISEKNKPVSGDVIAKNLEVSRQVIVQDIAILRANGNEIISTNKGYILAHENELQRVFKVIHTDEETQDELTLIVDLGGKVQDVFVYHKVYGVIKAEMNIKSRMDVKKYMEQLKNGKSSLLKNVTSGYHYHTVGAESEEILDIIQYELQKKGFLAKLQDYEPVNFWDCLLYTSDAADE